MKNSTHKKSTREGSRRGLRTNEQEQKSLRITIHDDLVQPLKSQSEMKRIPVSQLVNQMVEAGLADPKHAVHDQTDQTWLEGLSPQQLGTGIFLIPDVHSKQFGAAQRVLVQNITYSDCARRGICAMAFKWVPHTVKPYEELL